MYIFILYIYIRIYIYMNQVQTKYLQYLQSELVGSFKVLKQIKLIRYPHPMSRGWNFDGHDCHASN